MTKLSPEKMDRLVRRIAIALDGGPDLTVEQIADKCDLSKTEAFAVVGFLKSKGRIENRDGLLHINIRGLLPDDADREFFAPIMDTEEFFNRFAGKTETSENLCAAADYSPTECNGVLGGLEFQGLVRRLSVNLYQFKRVDDPPYDRLAAAPVGDALTELPHVVTPDMVLAALDVLPDPANPKAIAEAIKQQEDNGITDPFLTLGAALATLQINHQINLVGHDDEGYPLYETAPLVAESEPTTPGFIDPLGAIQIGGLVFHLPYEDLLPPLSIDEYADLKADIERRGIQDPLTVFRQLGQHVDVLDGAHRLKIAVALGFTLDQIPLDFKTALTPAEQRAIARSLNLHRRQLTPEQRREQVVQMRQEGESLRSIAATTGVSRETVRTDLAAAQKAGVKNLTPDTVTGRDGKQHPATKPAQDADRIYLEFAGRDKVHHDDIREQLPDVEATRRIKAMSLLEAQGRATPIHGWPGSYKFAPKPAPEPLRDVTNFLEDGKLVGALDATLDELHVTFDQSKITILGRTDDGARDRAIEVARKLVALGHWDGQTHIEFDAYLLHDELFGVRANEPVTDERLLTGKLFVYSDPIAASEPLDHAGSDTPVEPPAPYAVGDYVAWTAADHLTRVGIVREVHSDQLQVEAWNLPGDWHSTLMIDAREARVPLDTQYERLWLLSTRRSERDLLCVHWKDHFIALDYARDMAINGVGHNYVTREHEMGLAWRVSQVSIDHHIAQGDTVQILALEQLDARMQDIVMRAGRAKGGQIAQPPTPASTEPKGYENLVAPTASESSKASRLSGDGPQELYIPTHTVRVLRQQILDLLLPEEDGLTSDELRDHLGETGHPNDAVFVTAVLGVLQEQKMIVLVKGGRFTLTVGAVRILKEANVESGATRDSADMPRPAAPELSQPARDDSPERQPPPGVQFKRVDPGPAASSDYDPSVQAAIQLDMELYQAINGVLDALDSFERFVHVRGLALQPGERAESTNRLLFVLHERLRGAMNHTSDLNRQLTEAINDRPTITQEEQHELPTD